MIIFDLDGTLADCEHRRHFVQKHSHPDCTCSDGLNDPNCPRIYIDWKPDWKAFYEACDEDELIYPTINVFQKCAVTHQIEVWSGRCESVRDKTLK
jgi:phosphoglycolate phosphatase-like HAD superfamily hydrolase